MADMDAAVIKTVVDVVASIVKAKFARSDRPAIEANIERIAPEALAWSGRIQFYGMAIADDTSAKTVGLQLTAEPRKFYAQGQTERLHEDVLLNSPSHYLLLANVGAGKTTTLKRLTRKLLTSEPTGALDTYQLPIVVICRELGATQSLICHLATTLGIPFTDKRESDDKTEPRKFWCRD